jgi:hypothetical protein
MWDEERGTVKMGSVCWVVGVVHIQTLLNAVLTEDFCFFAVSKLLLSFKLYLTIHLI